VLNWVIDFSLRNRLLVIVAAVVFAVLGGFALRSLDIDAFPDTTPVQVQINTVAPALSPEEVEQQITFPIEQVLSGLPRIQQARSVSKFGLSQVVVTFEDGTGIYFARQLINERLATVEIPTGIERPKMGPVATGLGEVFHYVVTAAGADPTETRTLHDWVIKPKLRTVRGAAEINSWGGYEKQYQIRLDPDRLARHKLTFDEVVEAVQKNNRNVGGGNVRRGSQMLLVHGVGRTADVEQVKSIQIAAKDGIPIRVADVADVEIGHEIRRGAVTADGKGEVVLGLGFMLMGENSHEVTWALKHKLDQIKTTLPANVRVETVYDRTELVEHVIHTVLNNLFEAGLLVVAVLFLFLGNLRAAAIVALAIPLAMLFAFSGMLRFGIAASLLSLGAIDFGMIVDSSVVMVENCVRHLGHHDPGKGRLEVIREAAVEVRKPTLFGELIIMIVYLPILTLEGIEGKLFRPMALTVIFALAGSMILSLTLMPVLASLFLTDREGRRKRLLPSLFDRVAYAVFRLTVSALVWRLTNSWLLGAATLALLLGLLPAGGQRGGEPLLMRLAHAVHSPILRLCMRQKALVIAFALCVLVIAFGLIAPNLGSEFVPTLSEGAITVNVVRLAGTGLEQSIDENTKIEKTVLAAFPDEVGHVWSRIGTAEIATDPMGVELTDLFISLKARDRWTKAHTQEELTELIRKEIRPFLGPRFIFSQPIKLRLDEMVTGVRADVAVKIFGDDFPTLKAKAEEVGQVLRSVAGSADVNAEQITGQPVLQIKVDQDQIARYGVPAKAVLDLVESLGSLRLSEVVEGPFRFPLVIRLPEKYRGHGKGGEDAQKEIGELPVITTKGERIPLSRLARIEVLEDSPSTITREWGQRRVTVTCNVPRRDLGSFVAEAERRVRDEVRMPSERYHVEFGGQYEHLLSARNRLLVVVPLGLVLIFALLYLTYHNAVDAVRVFTGIPFAWVGGVFALWVRGMPFSVSAAIGFIAMSGVAVLDDMILVSYIRQLREKGLALDEAVQQAAVTRLRPVLMTTLVASLGFLPMAFSTGVGAEVQRPLATVVIGGVLSAMVMSLFVVRVLYLVFKSPVKVIKEPPEPAAAETQPGREAIKV
jgi:cobalt-zinc-cadmium resistance protein CzcA